MAKKSLQLPPFKTNMDDVLQVEQIREDAVARQTGEKGREKKGTGRKTYDSDRDRWKRMITITFPEQGSFDYLRETAEKMSEDRGVEISATKLGTLVMLAGLELLRRGKLELATEPTEVEKMVLKYIGEGE